MSGINDKYSRAREGENKSEIKDDTYTNDYDDHVVSHRKLKIAIGSLAFLLPIILILGSVSRNYDILPSISDYYHSVMKIFFTGVLFTISTFFWTFIGKEKYETNLNKTAAFLAMLVALIPTKNEFNIFEKGKSYTYEQLTGFQCYSIAHAEIIGTIHLVAAGLFFTVLIVMVFCIFLPRERISINPTIWKIRCYKISGWGMAASVFLILVFMLCGLEFKYSTFFLETAALWLFGLAWIVKGWDEDGSKRPTS